MSRIEITDLSKTFKDTKALSRVNLHFEENTIYGLLGRNGAGKSTLLNIINNRLFPDSGTVTLDGTPLTENTLALSRCFLLRFSAKASGWASSSMTLVFPLPLLPTRRLMFAMPAPYIP